MTAPPVSADSGPLIFTLDNGAIQVDLTGGTGVIARNGEEQRLSNIQTRILSAWARRAGHIVSVEDLTDEKQNIWKPDSYPGEKIIFRHVQKLREKIGPVDRGVFTFRGGGYVLMHDQAKALQGNWHKVGDHTFFDSKSGLIFGQEKAFLLSPNARVFLQILAEHGFYPRPLRGEAFRIDLDRLKRELRRLEEPGLPDLIAAQKGKNRGAFLGDVMQVSAPELPAHALGFLHQKIESLRHKPGNIVVSPTGKSDFLDFQAPPEEPVSIRDLACDAKNRTASLLGIPLSFPPRSSGKIYAVLALAIMAAQQEKSLLLSDVTEAVGLKLGTVQNPMQASINSALQNAWREAGRSDITAPRIQSLHRSLPTAHIRLSMP